MTDLHKFCMFSFSTQFENLGDCVINEVLIREICKFQKVMILGPRLPNWLERTVLQRGNAIIYRSRLKFALQILKFLIIRKRLTFFFKPGHMVRSPSFSGELRKSVVTAVTAALSLVGVKICRAGTSLDRYRLLEQFAQVQLGHLHALYGVRDYESLTMAKQFGIKSATFTPDLAFLLPQEKESITRRTEIGLSFRRRDWIHGDPWSTLINTVRTFITEHSFKPVVIQQVMFDQQVSEKLQSEIHADLVQFSGTLGSAEDIFERYRLCHVVVSNRLHSLLFAWMQGAIPIAVVDRTADQKLCSLFEQYELLELIIDIRQTEHLHAALEMIFRDSESIRKKLRGIAEREQALLRSIIARECDDNYGSSAIVDAFASENRT